MNHDWEIRRLELKEQEDRERNNLGPCPNCGHTEWKKGYYAMNYVYCQNCGLGVYHPYNDTEYQEWRKKYPNGERK